MHYQNNFNFLRLLFASFVLITHAYALLLVTEKEALYQLTNQIHLSSIGLNGFFILSGYLICMSLIRTPSVYQYIWNRILRIYPGLIVVLIISVFVGFFVYDGEIPYLKNNQVLNYVTNGISLLYLKVSIHNFFSSNPYPHAINGSLWTLIYEFSCYWILLALFTIRKTKYFVLALLLIAGYLLYLKIYVNPIYFSRQIHSFNTGKLVDFLLYFIIGAIFNFINLKNKKINYLYMGLGAILFGISLYLKKTELISYLSLPLIILPFGVLNTKILAVFNKFDISYGVYIYSFLIQQMLIYFFDLQSAGILTVSSLLISYLFGYLSWNLIEKQALRYKKTNIFHKFKELFIK